MPSRFPRILQAFRTASFAFGVVNLANPDMVGDTGVIPAVVRACEAECSARQFSTRFVTSTGLKS